jgi:hypothetical protein
MTERTGGDLHTGYPRVDDVPGEAGSILIKAFEPRTRKKPSLSQYRI